MYYRGANAAIICYDITSESSWKMVESWLDELRRNMTTKLSTPAYRFANKVVHLVGGKLDLCLQDPSLRAISFETACTFAAEHLEDLTGSYSTLGEDDLTCHEVSAKEDTGQYSGNYSNEGVEEVFLSIARKLVEQREEIEEQREALLYGRRQYTSIHPEDNQRPRGRGCVC
jgi:Ras-related protein Rab-21